ncbi:hypothetical protein GG851_20235 [Bordetella petrii]|nr:hypothetical protein [Bordetella petrii]
MPMLGDILAAARDSAGRFESWLRQSDPELAGQVASAAASDGLTPTAYVRVAVADFNRYANEEDWATLTSSIRNDADPGTVCLLAMVHWRLNAPGCEHHSAGRHESV